MNRRLGLNEHGRQHAQSLSDVAEKMAETLDVPALLVFHTTRSELGLSGAYSEAPADALRLIRLLRAWLDEFEQCARAAMQEEN